MQTLVLKPFYHRGKECIGLMYGSDSELTRIIRQLSSVRWTRTYDCWYIDCTKAAYDELVKQVSQKCVVDTSILKQYLQQRKVLVPVPKDKISAATATLALTHALHTDNLMALSAMRNMLVLKGYSPNTIRNYCNEFHQLLRLLGNRNVNELRKEQIMSYLLWMLEKKGAGEAQVHTAVNVIKFYFEQVMNRPKEFYDLPRPKKPWQLPSVLAEEEVVDLIRKLTNIKTQGHFNGRLCRWSSCE